MIASKCQYFLKWQFCYYTVLLQIIYTLCRYIEYGQKMKSFSVDMGM